MHSSTTGQTDLVVHWSCCYNPEIICAKGFFGGLENPQKTPRNTRKCLRNPQKTPRNPQKTPRNTRKCLRNPQKTPRNPQKTPRNTRKPLRTTRVLPVFFGLPTGRYQVDESDEDERTDELGTDGEKGWTKPLVEELLVDEVGSGAAELMRRTGLFGARNIVSPSRFLLWVFGFFASCSGDFCGPFYSLLRDDLNFQSSSRSSLAKLGNL